MQRGKSDLKIGAKLTLFLVSYAPLFIIMIVRQAINYMDYLHWGGFNKEAIYNYVQYFGVVTILLGLLICGFIGLVILLYNIDRRTITNGDLVVIKDIENKNSESISYLFTYVIPFVFQDLSDPTDVFSVVVLLVVTFFIYSNSSMLLINPTISMKYTLYFIEYKKMGSEESIKKGMFMSKNKYLEEGDLVKIKNIGHKLFFAAEGKHVS